MQASFKALALLAAAASASADVSSFKLRAYISGGAKTDFDKSVENQEITVDASTGFATLTQSGSGATFDDANNTINTADNSHIQVPTDSTHAVSFSSEPGTPAVDIEFDALQYANGVFMACPASMFGQEGDKVLIGYVGSGERVPEGCADTLFLTN